MFDELGIGKSMFANDLKEQIELENLIFEGKTENFERIKNLIPKFHKIYLQKLITQAVHPLKYKLYADIFALTGPLQTTDLPNKDFLEYMQKKGIIKGTDKIGENGSIMGSSKSIEEYENPIREGTLMFYIVNDDVNSFVSYATSNEIDLECDNLNNKLLLTINNKWFLSYLNFALFCGSLNIVKFLMLNNAKFEHQSALCSIQGGSEEVIEFLDSQKHVLFFDNKLQTAIGYHHNNICRWLFEKFGKGDATLPMCLQYFNTEMFFYFLNVQHWDIDEKNIIGNNSLDYAISNKAEKLASYLLLR